MDSDKKRFLFLLRTDTWGGAERRMANYCASADHAACKIIWGVDKDVFSRRFSARGIPVRVAELPPRNPDTGMLQRLFAFHRFLMDQRPDTVVVSNFWMTSFSAAELMIASLFTGGQVYMVAHDLPQPPRRRPARLHFGFIPGLGLSWRLDKLEKFLLARVPARTLAVGEPVKRHLVRNFGFPSGRIDVLRYGVDLRDFAPSAMNRREVRRRYGIGETDTVIVSASRLHKVKRLDRLLNAFAAAAAERDDLWLLMAGEGWERGKLADLARSFSGRIQKRIVFTGFVENVTPLLQAADIFVLSSATEGFCNACLEAMACGLVVVSTRCGGPEEYLTDGVSGLLVENSTRGVIDGVRKAVGLDGAERRALGAGARSIAEKSFDLTIGIEEFLSLVGLSYRGRAAVAHAVPEYRRYPDDGDLRGSAKQAALRAFPTPVDVQQEPVCNK